MRTFIEWILDSITHELHRKGDIECYEKAMELHPNYPKIWYNRGLRHKQKDKQYFKRLNLIWSQRFPL
jgi:tetratricopeptide (TPR) repeat protein